jgi:hypothetical protein
LWLGASNDDGCASEEPRRHNNKVSPRKQRIRRLGNIMIFFERAFSTTKLDVRRCSSNDMIVKVLSVTARRSYLSEMTMTANLTE